MSRFLIAPRWVVPVEPAGRRPRAPRGRRARRAHRSAASSGAAAGRFASYETLDLPDHVLDSGAGQRAYARRDVAHARPGRRPAARCAGSRTTSGPPKAGTFRREFVRDGTAARLRRDAARRASPASTTCISSRKPRSKRRAAPGCASRSGMIVIEFPLGLRLRRRRLPAQGPRAARPRGARTRWCRSASRRTRRTRCPTRASARWRNFAAELDLPVHVHLARDRGRERALARRARRARRSSGCGASACSVRA